MEKIVVVIVPRGSVCVPVILRTIQIVVGQVAMSMVNVSRVAANVLAREDTQNVHMFVVMMGVQMIKGRFAQQ